MDSANVYGVTGMPLSGKTTVAEILEEKGFAVLDMGEVVRKEMKKRDIPTEKTGEFVNSQREENGRDAIAKLSIPYLEKLVEESGKIVITGMRGWTERKAFENRLDCEFDVVSVWASRKTRRRRREERKREEDLKGQKFHERDLREIKNGVGKLMALSDIMIVNENISLDELREQVENKILR